VQLATTTTVDTSVKPGGEITYIQNIPIPSLDPAVYAPGATLSGNGQRPIFDQLVRVDSSGAVTPRLADSVTTTDLTNFTMKLHPGVVFSDGSPFNAAAIVYNWNRLKNAAIGTAGLLLMSQVDSYSAPDDTTFVWKLKAQNFNFLRGFESSLGTIGSPSSLPANDKQSGTVIGAGPFMVQAFTPNGDLVLVRNPRFFQAPLPYLDKITWRGAVDAQQRYNAAVSGQAQAVGFGSVAREPYDLEKQGWKRVSTTWIGGGGFMFNVAKPPFDDANLRKGFAEGLNRDQVMTSVADGVYPTANNVIASDSAWATPNGQQAGYNVSDAQKLINDYVAAHGNQDIALTLKAPDSYTVMAQAAAQQWNKLEHVKLSVQILDTVATINTARSKDFQLIAFAMQGIDPDTAFYQLKTGDPTNLTGFSNSQLDQYLVQGRQTLDFSQRKSIYDQAMKIITDQIPFIWTYNTIAHNLYDPKKLTNLNEYGQGWIDWPVLHKP